MIAAFAGAASAAFASPALAQSPPAALYDAIDAYVERQLSRPRVPGAALAIVEGDQVVHQRGFGQARPGGPAPSPETPFFIGSVTKSFTALAVMQLVEAGKVDLDAPVQQYLPWFRVADAQASAEITVRQLLYQTSGLSTGSGWVPDGDFDASAGAGRRQAEELRTVRLSHPPGQVFEYSNTNYNLLGLVVEAASGQSYAGYVQAHIFDPLDMRHTYTSRHLAQENGLAMGYVYWFGFPVASPHVGFPAGSLPSGQIISTSEDMSHYLIAQLNGGRYGDSQVLSPAGIAEMHRPAVEFSMMAMPGQYGMGWFVGGLDQAGIVWHDGVVPDFHAYAAIVPAQQKGLVLLLNADHFLMSQTSLLDIGAKAGKMLAGVQPAPRGFDPMAAAARAMPWLMRALLLIPLLQLLGIAMTIRRLRHWRQNPHSRPTASRKWALHVGLPLAPNAMLAGCAGWLATSDLRGFLFLFGPDFSWTAVISGGFAGVWLLIRTGLVLWALRRRKPPQPITRAVPEAA
ncbi:MAG TPA: serine hydrolase domain-containing protein [Chloroflexota bacterium]|nr:serine hydrolase domain-containing protein [Chloroflexota bacterium]